MRHLLRIATLLIGLQPLSAGAEAVVVAVDAEFASVAQVLTQNFTERTGHALELAVHNGTVPEAGVDVLLGPDTVTPARLAAEGKAVPESLVTYAMGATGTEEAALPRDAVLMVEARDNPVARDFISYLMTSDAWDLIVTLGYGAY